MKIYVSVLRKDKQEGQIDIVLGGPTLQLDVNLNTKIIDIKNMIQQKEYIPINEQIIVYKNEVLLDDKTLEYYNITNLSKIYQVYYFIKK